MTDDEIAAIEARLIGSNLTVARHAHNDVPALVAEVRRLREQLRIAEDVLNRIASCGCTKCPPPFRDLAEARVMADDALTRMSVVE